MLLRKLVLSFGLIDRMRHSSVTSLKHEDAAGEPLGKSNSFYAGIQDLRGWAAIFVLLYHAHVLFKKDKYFGANLFSGFFEIGHHGVDLFFVISGFLMAMLKQNSSGTNDAVSFALARVKRIYLPFLPVFIVLSTTCFFVSRVCPVAQAFDAKSILMGIFIFPREDLNTFVPGVAWTLAHELFFYSMICISIALRTVGNMFLVVWFCISLFLTFANLDLAFPVTFIFSKFNLAFGLGMLAFLLVRIINGFAIFNGIRVFGFGLPIVLSMIELSEITLQTSLMRIFLDLGFFIASFFVVLGSANLTRKSLKILGDSSYSIYLVHYPVLVVATMMVVRFFVADYNLYLLFFLISAVALFSGFVYYYLIEYPLVKISKRVSN